MADKILIVDDDRELRCELRELLEGYDVIEASNGEEAVGILKKANEIGLVILDVMMPGMNGIDLLGMIKKSDPELNIVILTGHSSKDVAVEALKGRADDYIEKPLNIGEITAAVERLLGEPSGAAPDIDSMNLRDKVEKVKRFIERNRYKKITLSDAARSVCISPKYLSRAFKIYSKKGFNDYKLTVKINAARELLEKSGYNVDEISNRLGYENAESFIRQFKKITGKPPAGYRKRFLKKSPKAGKKGR